MYHFWSLPLLHVFRSQYTPTAGPDKDIRRGTDPALTNGPSANSYGPDVTFCTGTDPDLIRGTSSVPEESQQGTVCDGIMGALCMRST